MHQNWTIDQLIDQWTLLLDERAFVLRHKTDANRLAVALLFKYFQIVGRFPRRRQDVPTPAITFVARQFSLDPASFSDYNWQGRTIKFHRAAIRAWFGFREATVADAESVIDWLCVHSLPDNPSDDLLKTIVLTQYQARKIEPPTTARIERLMRTARYRYSEQFCTAIYDALPALTRESLEKLLEQPTQPDGTIASYSSFATLKRDTGNVSLNSIMKEIAKLQQIEALALPNSLFVNVPSHAIHLLAERAGGERPREIKRHSVTLRYTLLAAFCFKRQQTIRDNLVDLFSAIIRRIEKTAQKADDRLLLKQARRMRGCNKLLGRISIAAIRDPDASVRNVIYPIANEQKLEQIANVHEEVDSVDDIIQQTARRSYSRHYRRMIPLLLKALSFHCNNEDHQPLITAIDLIRQYVDTAHIYFQPDDTVPITDVVPPAWRPLVLHTQDDGTVKVNRISYEVCVCLTLREQLRCRAIWVDGADRYRNPDLDLPTDFQQKRSHYYDALQQPMSAKTFVNRLRQAMITALDALNSGLKDNKWVKLDPDVKHPIRLTPLPAQPAPLNLAQLKREIQQRWPMTPLLEMLKEVDLQTGFSDRFQTSATSERLAGGLLRKRLLLCLYALGTNTGFERVGDEETRDALRHIQRRYLTKANMRAAIAEVVNATFDKRQPHIWGDATTACAADSKKFAAWDQNLLTEWHVRYRGPGIMVYWHVDRKAACIHSQVKSVSSSEVAAMIEGVLHHCTEMAVDRSYVDSHGQSTVAFAFCHLLGFRLLPRLKPIRRQKLFMPNKEGASDFKHLQPILTRAIRWDLIEANYNEMVKYATALRLGTADAESILRRFTRHGIMHPTYKALLELGKAARTIFVAEYLHSEALRREIQEGLNVVENWNSVNTFIFFGRSSEISSNDRHAQEISILSMHLLQACLVYINTLMIQRVLQEPEWRNRLEREDLRALSPLLYRHVTPYGRFDLDMSKRLNFD